MSTSVFVEMIENICTILTGFLNGQFITLFQKKPESCQRLNDYVHHILRTTTGLHIPFDTILEKHVRGYQLANSRAYDMGVKFLFASSEFRPKQLQYQLQKLKTVEKEYLSFLNSIKVSRITYILIHVFPWINMLLI